MPRVMLPTIDARIDTRARATREAHPWWPCAEGCDHCCRSLPHLPTMTAAEWERLAEALKALPAAVREDVLACVDAAPSTGPLTCPMLDGERGSCRVYAARPVACRTYGFYAERDGGLHCADVTRAVERHADGTPVIWGNGDAIADDMKPFGEVRSLRAWLEAQPMVQILELPPNLG